MMTKEERDKRDLILERLNACAKMELQKPKITAEELDDWTQKIVEQALTIEALKEQNNALGKSNAALSEKLDKAREAAGKAIEDRKILKEKTDAQEKRIEDLRNLLDDQLKTKEQNRRYRKIILEMAADLYDAH